MDSIFRIYFTLSFFKAHCTVLKAVTDTSLYYGTMKMIGGWGKETLHQIKIHLPVVTNTFTPLHFLLFLSCIFLQQIFQAKSKILSWMIRT